MHRMLAFTCLLLHRALFLDLLASDSTQDWLRVLDVATREVLVIPIQAIYEGDTCDPEAFYPPKPLSSVSDPISCTVNVLCMRSTHSLALTFRIQAHST